LGKEDSSDEPYTEEYEQAWGVQFPDTNCFAKTWENFESCKGAITYAPEPWDDDPDERYSECLKNQKNFPIPCAENNWNRDNEK